MDCPSGHLKLATISANDVSVKTKPHKHSHYEAHIKQNYMRSTFNKYGCCFFKLSLLSSHLKEGFYVDSICGEHCVYADPCK